MYNPLTPETIEKISKAQTPVAPSTTEYLCASLQNVIDNSAKWRTHCFVTGNLRLARTTAVMIGRKRSELRALKGGM